MSKTKHAKEIVENVNDVFVVVEKNGIVRAGEGTGKNDRNSSIPAVVAGRKPLIYYTIHIVCRMRINAYCVIIFVTVDSNGRLRVFQCVFVCVCV